MIPSEDQELLDEYFGSTLEITETAEGLLLEMEHQESPAPERIRDLKRAFHTLKGNSAMMGFEAVADLSHALEDLLDCVQGSGFSVKRIASPLLSGLGLISGIARERAAPTEPPSSWADVMSSLRRLGEEASTPAPPAPAAALPAAPQPAVEDLKRRYLGARERSVRVSEATLDSLLDLCGELHVLVGGLLERARGSAGASEEEAARSREAERIAAAFHLVETEVLAARLVPVGPVLSRFHMLVRDLAASEGKEISFVLIGEDTTVDKAVVDELSEPLLHLVRNAIDHGIEMPAEREAAGKPREATITLAARQVSGAVEISILDDGRGIDCDRIRRKAREKSILVEGMDDRSVLDLIFLPAFSTKDDVTMLSGRGVGLDVVRTSVEKLGGSVALQTLPGRGTEFRLNLPLTLSLGHGLLLEVGREAFALPIAFVAETIRIPEEAHVGIEADGMLDWRGERLPAIPGGRLLKTNGTGRHDFAVILAGGGRKKALLVDGVLSHQDLVLKRLDKSVGEPFGISGATLLGDGRIVMMLDAHALLEWNGEDSRPVRRGGAP